MTFQFAIVLGLALLCVLYFLKDLLRSALRGGCGTGCGACKSGCALKKLEAAQRDLDKPERHTA